MIYQEFLKKTTIITLILFVLSTMSTDFLVAQEQDFFVTAQAMYQSQRYDEALVAVNKFIENEKQHPESKDRLAEAYYFKARVCFVISRDFEAEESLSTLFGLYPEFTCDEYNEDFKAMVDRVKSNPLTQAKKLLADREYIKSSVVLQKFIDDNNGRTEQKSNLAFAYFMLARIAHEVQDLEVCDTYLKSLFELDPHFSGDPGNPEFTEHLRLMREQFLSQKTRNDQSQSQNIVAKPKVMEKSSSSTLKKKKRFPWLFAVLGVGAVAVLVVLLIKKKNSQDNSNPSDPNIPNIEMVYLSGGTFQMGSNSGEFESERPVHSVTLSSFKIGKYEVTQKQWRQVMGTNPSHFTQGDDYPVENVSWNDVQAFIQKLCQMTGKPYRLPTEAEWEYACRGGTTGERYGDINAIAWYSGNSGNMTHPIGQKQSNSYGLYDMLGNVEEWCQDWHDFFYYYYSPSYDPKGPDTGVQRILRGGCYYYDEQGIRAAYRGAMNPTVKRSNYGFRLAMDN